MSSLADAVAEAIAAIPTIDATIIGTFVRPAGVQAVVNVGATQITVPMIGQYFPVAADPCRLLRVGKQTFLLGPTSPKSPIGRVTATGSPRCTVEYPSGSGITQQMGYPSNITPAVNDIVLIDWTSGGTVIDKITAAPIGTIIADPPSTGGGTKTQVFTASDSGTFYIPGSKWNTSEVWSVTTGNNRGAWFYGTNIGDTIPDTALINSVEIYLPIFFDGGSTPQAQVHTSASKPGGNVSTVGSSSALVPNSGWTSLPTAFLDYLKVNPGGIALVGGGYQKYRGSNTDGQSGALRVTYTT